MLFPYEALGLTGWRPYERNSLSGQYVLIAVDIAQVVFTWPKVKVTDAAGLWCVESMTAGGIHDYRIKQQSIGRDRVLILIGISRFDQAREILMA